MLSETWLIDALAVYRLTVLVQQDTVPPAEYVRNKIEERGGLLAEMWECPFCLSFWLAIVCVVLSQMFPRVWYSLSRVLAFSAVVGLLHEWEQTRNGISE